MITRPTNRVHALAALPNLTFALALASTGVADAAPPPSDPSSERPVTTLYDPGDYEESALPDQFTSVGPFTADFPCAGLSVEAAAELLPEVTGAALTARATTTSRTPSAPSTTPSPWT